MSNRLGGKQGTAYLGTNADSPPNIFYNDRPPTQYDSQNYSIMDEWFDVTTQNWYKLVALAGNNISKGELATWTLITAGAGFVGSLTTDDANVVTPNAGNINTFSSPSAGNAISNINTIGSVANTVGIALNNSISQPDTNASGTEGLYSLGGNRFMHNFGATPNVFLGKNSGNLTNTANTSIGIGNDALSGLTSGNANIAIGSQTLLGVTSGTRNVAIGSSVADTLITGTDNTAVGFQAMQACSDVSENTAVGFGALGVTSTNNNTAVGYRALITNSGLECTAVGSSALDTNTGNHCVAVGFEALGAANSGNDNIAIGYRAQRNNNGGSNNIAIGIDALRAPFTLSGSNNIAIGNLALEQASAATSNIAIGSTSQSLVNIGNQNTSIGDLSLANITTGSDNIGIGFSAGISYLGVESSNVVISNSGVVAESNVIRIGTNGGGVGQQNACFIAGTNAAVVGSALFVDPATFQIGTIASSIRFKENVKDMGSSSNDLMKLRPVIFNYKQDGSKSKQYGFIAEEVKEIMPEIVVHDKDGEVYSVKYHELSPLIVNELIRLNKKVEDLEKRIK